MVLRIKGYRRDVCLQVLHYKSDGYVHLHLSLSLLLFVISSMLRRSDSFCCTSFFFFLFVKSSAFDFFSIQL